MDRSEPLRGLRLTLRGVVQGVGFRPFVHRLANDLSLAGWVTNSANGVTIELEGPTGLLNQFLDRLQTEKPSLSQPQVVEVQWISAAGHRGFQIRSSSLEKAAKTALVPPDVATCADCLKELFDPANRRYHYPFVNCTNCGPRYTIIEALPYDRPNTSMKNFELCGQCAAEYSNPADRRFHAQPNACPKCGPQLELWNARGEFFLHREEAWSAAVHFLRQAAIVAVKGLGGFHLVTLADRPEAVEQLRKRKHREEKPLALMYPNLESARVDCAISEIEAELLTSPAAPIVLLTRKPGRSVYHGVAPDNPRLGVMLPSSPLYHLLLAALNCPVVVTSGNLSEEPICTDEHEVVERLRGIADFYLVNNRPIVRPVDDSVAVVAAGRELLLRRARGFAPLPVEVMHWDEPVLAVGGHLKNTVALAIKGQAFISQHIGDLETEKGLATFRSTIKSLETLYEVSPEIVASDLHPDYLSTQEARRSAKDWRPVQHHIAHVFSCMAENHLEAPLLGVAWDGSGLGTDQTIWGGEFFRITSREVVRFAHLRTFPLPGGDKAAREPRYSAAGLLHEAYGPDWINHLPPEMHQAFSEREAHLLRSMLDRKMNCPRSSSIGRLFDAVAALCGVRQRNAFEGQSAMALEFRAQGATADWPDPVATHGSSPLVLDWQSLVDDILKDRAMGASVQLTAAKFHGWLVAAIVSVARAAGERRVCLSGGCFQNCRLTEVAVRRLQAEGFEPYWHRKVPPNDGGLALGQIAAVLHSSYVSGHSR